MPQILRARLVQWYLNFHNSVFKTHNLNPKLITQFSNLTFTQKLQNSCLDSVLSNISLQLFSKTVDPTTDTTRCCYCCYPRLSIFSLPSTHSHSPAPSTTTNPPPLTQPLATISHYKPIHHHKPNNHQQNQFINKTQQPSTKPIYQPSTKSKPIHQNKNKTQHRQQNHSDKIKTQHQWSWSWCFKALALMVAVKLGWTSTDDHGLMVFLFWVIGFRRFKFVISVATLEPKSTSTKQKR